MIKCSSRIWKDYGPKLPSLSHSKIVHNMKGFFSQLVRRGIGLMDFIQWYDNILGSYVFSL